MNTSNKRYLPYLGHALLVAPLAGRVADVSADDEFKMHIHPRETEGIWALVNHDYRQAIARLEIDRARSRRNARNWGAILSNLCVAYARAGDYQRAGRYCDRAVDDDPRSGIALNNRGVLAALQQNFAAAAADFEAARERRGSSGFAEHNIRRLGEQVSHYRGDSPAETAVASMS